MLKKILLFNDSLDTIQQPKALINTINAHSYNTMKNDAHFEQALQNSDVLLPDGISVVWAKRMLTGEKIQKIAGYDLFLYEMQRVNSIQGKCFFLGSTVETLSKIKKKAALEYPNLQIKSYSPPYKQEFSDEDSQLMIDAVNAVEPDVLFIGMTAPKQEKWAYLHFDKMKVGHVCCIGAVFDFYAGVVKRAPSWMIQLGLEWAFRLIKEPRRMWRRYLVGNCLFIRYILIEKFKKHDRFVSLK